MNEALEKINRSATSEAESMFRDCCGSTEWVRRMAESRPFNSESELFETAIEIWNSLQRSDWFEAFEAHPKIGESKAARSQQKQSAEWSSGEQAGTSSANNLIRQDLSDANRKYFERFGFIFIVCATGKTAQEMLELCNARLGNDVESEVKIAAEEQEKITEIRLRKLLTL